MAKKKVTTAFDPEVSNHSGIRIVNVTLSYRSTVTAENPILHALQLVGQQEIRQFEVVVLAGANPSDSDAEYFEYPTYDQFCRGGNTSQAPVSQLHADCAEAIAIAAKQFEDSVEGIEVVAADVSVRTIDTPVICTL